MSVSLASLPFADDESISVTFRSFRITRTCAYDFDVPKTTSKGGQCSTRSSRQKENRAVDGEYIYNRQCALDMSSEVRDWQAFFSSIRYPVVRFGLVFSTLHSVDITLIVH
jgi:hypothetical protein